ncbi:MAG TPA: imidazole glycerol phosphate synthase subunit HisH [Pirellulales bacterium]|nr:imidazole glycerol phosphate synthase subunit HisH [Pirellulales bacterium]
MIAVIDYGMGNLRSVQKGFEKVGHEAVITSDPATIDAAERVVLPGVGAFGDAMHELRERGLADVTRRAARSGRPFLGICLGLQLLFEVSYEGGRHEGLGILGGEVVRFAPREGFKVPHMGWNELELRQPQPLFAGLSSAPYVYFVHSYYVVPNDRTVIAAEANYPQPFTAAIARDNLFATQFHPEKSQSDGLRILRNFAELPAQISADR